MMEEAFRPVLANLGVARRDHVVEVGDALLELSADAADKPIAKWREATEQNGGTILCPAIGLRKWSEDDIAFVHLRRSASV